MFTLSTGAGGGVLLLSFLPFFSLRLKPEGGFFPYTVLIPSFYHSPYILLLVFFLLFDLDLISGVIDITILFRGFSF